jgi:1,4-alpha-glucan branching enzyme
VSRKHQDDKVIVFERGPLLWLFNFHTHKSYTDYRAGVNTAGTYRVVLNSDSAKFGGHDRIDESVRHFTQPGEWDNRQNSLQVTRGWE